MKKTFTPFEICKFVLCGIAILFVILLIVAIAIPPDTAKPSDISIFMYIVGEKNKLELIKLIGWGISGLIATLGVMGLLQRASALDKQNRMTEESHIQERFNKATEHLGHASMSVRIAAFNEFCHLVEIKLAWRKNIFDILCAHLRQTTKHENYEYTIPTQEVQSLLKILFINKSIFDGMGSDLEGVHLQGANLQEAKLQGANLQGAYLHEAKLQGANLQEANLQKANLQEANLQKANLQKANLQKANLQKANLQKANLQEANLQEANLQEVVLHNANLQEVNLQEAKLQGANLYNVNLQGAKLQKAKLQETKLLNTDLQGAYLIAAKLHNADMRKANLQGANLQDAEMNDVNIRGANLQDADLTDVDMRGANLQDADLTDVHMQGATISEKTQMPPSFWELHTVDENGKIDVIDADDDEESIDRNLY